jgi:hypothetical protein
MDDRIHAVRPPAEAASPQSTSPARARQSRLFPALLRAHRTGSAQLKVLDTFAQGRPYVELSSLGRLWLFGLFDKLSGKKEVV